VVSVVESTLPGVDARRVLRVRRARVGSPTHFGGLPFAAVDVDARHLGSEEAPPIRRRIRLLCSERSPIACHRTDLAHSLAIECPEVVALT
jgi:hypothetical protein